MKAWHLPGWQFIPQNGKIRKQKAERRSRWLMFWIVTGVLILSLLLYPVAISIAHHFDNSEKDALVDSRRM